jgi:hypothetical protein
MGCKPDPAWAERSPHTRPPFDPWLNQPAFGGSNAAVRAKLIQPRIFNMKILLTIAATLAASTSVSAASASERGGGHYEWQNRAQSGPNKSNLSSRVRVWVKDMVAVADCDCTMMKDKASAAVCMDMPDHGARHSKG